jgi:hypothetical protein
MADYKQDVHRIGRALAGQFCSAILHQGIQPERPAESPLFQDCAEGYPQVSLDLSFSCAIDRPKTTCHEFHEFHNAGVALVNS